jgi:hypothetical protein
MMKYLPSRPGSAQGVLRLLLSLCALNAAVNATAPAPAQGGSALRPLSINSGDFTVSYDPAGGLITVGRAGRQVSLATRLAGGELFGATLPQFTSEVSHSKAGDVTRVTILSEREWAKFRGTVETYAGAPGLFRFRLDVTAKRPTLIS